MHWEILNRSRKINIIPNHALVAVIDGRIAISTVAIGTKRDPY